MRQRPLSYSLIKVMTLVILVFSIQGGLSLLTGLFSLGDSQAINDSGSLRMRAYQLAVLMRSEPAQVAGKLSEYDSVLYSPALARTLNWYMPRQAGGKYQRVIHEWQKMKTLARKGDVDGYEARLVDFVDRIHALVDALEDFNRKKLVMLVISQFAAMVLVMTSGWFIYRRVRQQLVQPLEALERGAKSIAKRKFGFFPPRSSFRELSILGDTMANTAGELDALYSQLAAKVEAQDLALKAAHQRLSFLYRVADNLNCGELQPARLREVLECFRQHLGAEGVELCLDSEPVIRLGTGPWLQRHALVFKGIPLGNLKLSQQESDTDLVANFCQLLAQTLYWHQNRQAQQRLGLMEERATIARELHDSLGQLLAYMKIQLALLNRAIKSGDPELVDTSQQELKSSLDKAYGQLRELLGTFRLKLEAPDLNRSLVEMVDELRQRTDSTIHLEQQLPTLGVSSAQQVHLLQLVREAVTNAIKHARANNIWVSGRGDHGSWSVTIEDDGIGMTIPDDPAEHFGLGIMAERARNLNARFNLDASPKGGVRVRLTVNKENDND